MRFSDRLKLLTGWAPSKRFKKFIAINSIEITVESLKDSRGGVMSRYGFVFLTILFTSYGQIIIKWRLLRLPELSGDFWSRLIFLTKVAFSDFFILSGFAAAYCAAMCWMMAIKKLQLNVAYPLMSLSFVLVFILSSILFNEKTTFLQIAGLILILFGVSLVGFSMSKPV